MFSFTPDLAQCVALGSMAGLTFVMWASSFYEPEDED